MFLSSQRLTDGMVCDRLGENIALEYIRDSPLFRQQLYAFEESSNGLQDYLEGIKSAIFTVNSAITNLQQAYLQLSSSITGRGNTRCLFTNAYPKLGLLTNSLHEVSQIFLLLNDNFDTLKVLLNEQVENILLPLQHLFHENLIEKRKKYEKLSELFEQKILSTLNTRNISLNTEQEICNLRMEYELNRYDYVVKLNQNNCHKKYLLTKFACQFLNIFENFFHRGSDLVDGTNKKLESVQLTLPEVKEEIESQEMLWGRIRARLQGELLGAMPPPGAPAGALSPVQPRRHQGIPLYSTAITTEVLSIHTRKATFDDTRHANDEGVFKQGYLCVKSGIFGTKKRKWHRLYSTKLYVIEPAIGQPSCTMETICDITDCSVTAKPSSEIPYVFVIASKEGTRYEFQAESEDDMVLWISAIRRCAVTAPGRHTTALSRKQLSLDGENGSIQEEDEDKILVPPETPQDGPGRRLLRQFIQSNRRCAECGSGPIRWVSTSIGVTLCQQCAIVHRHLTWAISKLKSVELDEFSEWQMKILMYELGNDVVNSIWEKNIPEGWTKPCRSSSPEDRSKWILAKYKWYAFVEEFRVTSDEQLVQSMLQAVENGSVASVLYCMSLKAQVNCSNPSNGDTPLHLAVALKRVNVFGFLLLNGADPYAKNNSGIAPLDLISGHRLMEEMLTQIQKGHY